MNGDDDVRDSAEHTPVDDDVEGPTHVAADPPPFVDSKISSLPKLEGTYVETSEDEVLAPGTLVGEYKIDRQVGEGGMGTVYAATHPLIGKRAAVKVIKRALGWDRASVARFMQEARSVNQINHPNIVDVFSFGNLPDGRCYFVMEWLAGRSLAQYLREGPLAWDETTRILDQIADALEAAHEKGIVHRDLKPENVCLVPARGQRHQAKLLDFGIAKLKSADSGVGTTQTGVVMGTPAYLSPEQARGKSVDHATDIYALGCMGYELITGHLPFEAESAVDIIAAHLNQPPPRLEDRVPDAPVPLADLLWRMMAKKSTERPTLVEVRATCQYLLADPTRTPARPLQRAEIQRLLPPPDPTTDSAQTLDVIAPLQTTEPTPRRESSSSSLPAALLIAALVMLAGYLLLFRDEEPAPIPAPTVAPLERPAEPVPDPKPNPNSLPNPAPTPSPVVDPAPPVPPERAGDEADASRRTVSVAALLGADLAAGAAMVPPPAPSSGSRRRPHRDTTEPAPKPAPEPPPPDKPADPPADPRDYTINPFKQPR